MARASARWAAILGVSLMGCTARYVSGPPGPISAASVVDVHPDRPRYRYRAPEGELKLHARTIQVKVLDQSGRKIARTDTPEKPVLIEATGEEPIEVSAHRDFAATLQNQLHQRIDADPNAPAITVYVLIEHVLAWRGEDQRELGVRLTIGVETDDGLRLSGANGKAGRTISGPPYDASEFDDLHLGMCLEAFDRALSASAVTNLNKAIEESKQDQAASDET